MKRAGQPAQPRRPRGRNDFNIAIICALTLESDAVQAIFDGFWEGLLSFGKAPGDQNAYTLGWIDDLNVVLVHMPGMGKAAAAAAAASLRSSFPHIRLGLLVGICGGVPKSPDGQDIFLGDVVVSTGVVQYDFTRQFPDKTVRKDTIEDNLGRPNGEIRSFIGKIKGARSRQLLINHTWTQLVELQGQSVLKAEYPGVEQDKLFQSNYRHKHNNPADCTICAACVQKEDYVCDSSRELSCAELGCDNEFVLPRNEQSVSPYDYAEAQGAVPTQRTPVIHFGRVASGDGVMKSGHHRDDLAAQEKVVAFEMEGAGVWESFPTIILKGVCDYSDSHKNKIWQSYAAASAAACTKALLSQWTASENSIPSTSSHRINTTPSNAISNFIGRHDLLEQIDASLFGAPDDDSRSQVIVLRAMGGQGKTQLAIQACKRAQNTHEGIFWVSAKSRDTAEKAFESLADELNTTGRILSDTKSKVKFVFNYLQSWDHRWLLVLDNFDQVENFKTIREFMPSSCNGTIVITSRNEETGRLGTMLEVPSMIEDNGEELLLRRYWNKKETAEEMREATKVVERLGGLALALDQAASYINFVRMNLFDFLSKYETKKRGILEYRPDLFEYHSDSGDSVSILTTWEMSFDQIVPNDKERRKHLEDFLAISACMDSRNITENIFNVFEHLDDEPISCLQIFEQQTIDGPRTWNSESFLQIVSQLRKIGILRGASDSSDNDIVSFSMHPVIKDWLQKRNLSPEYQNMIVLHCLKILVAAIIAHPIASDSLEKRKWLLAHVEACILFATSNAYNLGLGSDSMRHESLVLSNFFRDQSQYSQSAAIMEPLVKEDRESPTVTHEEKITSISNLARTYVALGNRKEVERLDLEVLEAQILFLGDEDPSTLSSMHNLAMTYYKQSRLKEAETLALSILQSQSRLSGKKHSGTLSTMNLLAYIYKGLGRLKEAEALGIELMEIGIAILGEEHATMQNAISNLAMTYEEQGLPGKAEALHTQVLEIKTRVLGKEHPKTLRSMLDLARVYRIQKRLTEADTLCTQVLEMQTRVLGTEHPSTLLTLSNLASIYLDQDQLENAEALHVEVLEMRTRVLGEDSLDTIRSMSHLADVYTAQDRSEEAEKFSNLAAERVERAFGGEHPDTLILKTNLAWCYQKQERYEEAETLLLHVIEASKRTLGKNHPRTINRMNNLASVYQDQGQRDEVEVLKL